MTVQPPLPPVPAPLPPLIPCTRRYMTSRAQHMEPGTGFTLWLAGTLSGAAHMSAAVILGPESTDIRGWPVFPLTSVPAPLAPAVFRAEFVLTVIHAESADRVRVATFTQVTVSPAAMPAMVIQEVGNTAVTWPLFPPGPLQWAAGLPPEIEVYGLTDGTGVSVTMSHFEVSP